MVDIQEACDTKRVLWLVWGRGAVDFINCVKIFNNTYCGYTVWGYSVYRRSPGFRTIGMSLESLTNECEDLQLFTDINAAIEYYVRHQKDPVDVVALKQRLTPNLKFLERENFRHNLTVEL